MNNQPGPIPKKPELKPEDVLSYEEQMRRIREAEQRYGYGDYSDASQDDEYR